MIKTHLGEIVPWDKFTPAQVLDSLRGLECQACGGLKRKFMAFCTPCYKRLPEIRRRDLVKSMRDGFAEAFVAALRFLATENTETSETV